MVGEGGSQCPTHCSEHLGSAHPLPVERLTNFPIAAGGGPPQLLHTPDLNSVVLLRLQGVQTTLGDRFRGACGISAGQDGENLGDFKYSTIITFYIMGILMQYVMNKPR